MVMMPGEYPVASVHLFAGQVSVELMGRVETLLAGDEPTGFNAGVGWVATRARELGRPVRAWVVSPTRTWLVAVAGDGHFKEIGPSGLVSGPPTVADPDPASMPPRARADDDEYNDPRGEADTASDPDGDQPTAIVVPDGVEAAGSRQTAVPVGATIPSNTPARQRGHRAATCQIATATAQRRGWWRGQAELAGPDSLTALRQLTYLVANRKGQAGKTPVAVLLAAAFATKRPNDVVLVDLNPVGNLALRTVQSSTATVSDLVAALKGAHQGFPDVVDLDELMQWQPEGYFTVPSRDSLVIQQEGDEPVLAPRLSRHDVDLLAAALTKRRHVVGLDGGNNDADEAWQRAADLADVLVVPVKWDPPTCTLAGQMLDELAELGRSDLSRTAIIVPTWSPAETADKGRARSYEAHFRSAGHRVMPIPPDPHLVGKGIITWARLKPATRHAALALAREVARVR